MNQTMRRHTLGELLHRSAARHPAKLAITCGDHVRWTYAEFDALCSRFAAGLAHTLQVRKGDRVAVSNVTGREAVKSGVGGEVLCNVW